MIYEIGLGDDIDLKKGTNNDFYYHPRDNPIKDFYDDKFLKYYIQHFENVMIDDLINIYTVKSQEWRALTSPEYCKSGVKYITQELIRSEEYYNLSAKKVKEVLIRIIIDEKYEEVCGAQTGVLNQLQKRSIEDLKSFYSLFKISVLDKHKFYESLKKISNILGDYIQDNVKDILSKQRESEKGQNQDVVGITTDLLELCEYVEKVIKEAFDNDRDIGKESDHFIQQSLNNYKSQDGRKCATIFAEYSHHLLTKDSAQNTSEEEFDRKIDVFFKLINKIYDKDIFINESRTLLARRLLEKPTIDTEKKFLGKMGTDWGLGDQSKMKNMLDDIVTSEEMMKEWKTSNLNKTKTTLEVYVKVLRVSCWPDRLFQKDLKIFTSEVDGQIEQIKKDFFTFYQYKNQGKGLSWVVNYGNAEVKTTVGGKSYFLLTTMVQMGILSLFNSKPRWSFKDLKEKIQYEGDTHKQIQEALKLFGYRNKLFKVARKDPAKADPSLKIPAPFDEDDEFEVNDDFKSDKLRLNCIPIMDLRKVEKRQGGAEESDVMKEREFVIDAAIVRIMKSRRELPLTELQEEVKKLISLFVPEPKMIKIRSEALMERDFLERHPTKKGVYVYKP